MVKQTIINSPCPFCKGTDLYTEYEDYIHYKIFYVHCENCGTDGPREYTEEESIEAWKRRK